eukprot:gnl/TRDRNA2_/TRDRNA2_85768_c0_seq1.p1 gnl/TRDRNA2_/TRDRNA2_85768_c0~~gnl/TRDRNA2_/TRDRNA2_85768_c0_seq1.p1  ORF type:complete len:255 (-),score=43.62 gnl/TRDRNA2_/TRDRNA2_85768_c0_seq1:122-886(-)
MSSFVVLLCSYHLALVASGKVPVTMVELQGCPDCSTYGDRLVAQGLKKGLGAIMDMKVYYVQGHHAGIDFDPQLHSWVACSQDMGANSPVAQDSTYMWYQVTACSNPGKKIDDCIHETGMPNTMVNAIKSCVNNHARQQALVTKMQSDQATKVVSFPWAIVDGVSLPEPDENGNDVTPLIALVCAKAGWPATTEACRHVPRESMAAGSNQTTVAAAKALVKQVTSSAHAQILNVTRSSQTESIRNHTEMAESGA